MVPGPTSYKTTHSRHYCTGHNQMHYMGISVVNLQALALNHNVANATGRAA